MPSVGGVDSSLPVVTCGGAVISGRCLGFQTESACLCAREERGKGDRNPER